MSLHFLCRFLCCNQKENKEIKEHKDVIEIKEQIKKYNTKKRNEHRARDKIYCFVCDMDFRADGYYQKHIRKQIHIGNVLKYIDKEFKRDDIDVDIFIKCEKSHNFIYNRSSDGSYSKKKIDYNEYLEFKKKEEEKELKK